MNKYEVQGVIDEGAYGIVLKALLRDTEQVFAIKKFKETDEDPAVRAPIQREIRMLKALRSEFVVDIKEAFRRYSQTYRRKGKVYLVFQFMEKNLLQLIEENPTGITPDLAQRLTYQIIRCIHFIHKKDVVHRDLKPQNLLLSDKYALKLCDFGFTRTITSSDQALTDYVATRWYRSPELLVGQRYGKPLDMWSIGCIAFEMMTGEPLFPGENEIDQLHLIRKSFGELTSQQKDRMKTNPRFTGVKFPEIRKLDTIQSKLLNKAPKAAIQFIKDCLKIAPPERLTAEDALQHPFFASLRLANVKQHSTTERTDHTSPPYRRDGVSTEKNGYRTKTIDGNTTSSNDNAWRFAGAGRFDNTKYRKVLKETPAGTIPNLNVTQLHPNHNGSPQSYRSPSKDTIKSYVRAKMSLNVNNNQNEHKGRKLRSTFKNQQERLANLKINSLANAYYHKGLRTKASTIEHPQLSFSIAGQAKSITKKL